MEYTPKHLPYRPTNVCEISDICSISASAIVRKIKVSDFGLREGRLLLHSTEVPVPLSIDCKTRMTFGTETVTAKDYFRWVIERDDYIDALVLPQINGVIPISTYWIHINYVGTPSGSFSKKDDGLFALRAKAGEKAERHVTRYLIEKFGHSFPDDLSRSPGYFEIRYKHKKKRLPDRICSVCGLEVEVKKRNRDRHFRVSHSQGREFGQENSLEGWHAFVFSDMKPRFLANAEIMSAIQGGNFQPGRDQYDRWADVDGLTHCDPPKCFLS